MLTIRPVAGDDCRLIWQWANDEQVRRWSFESGRIEWDTHVAWFNRRLGDPDYLMYVLLGDDGMPAGLVRFEVAGDGGVVGISIAAEHRGRGYAVEALRLACAEFFATTGAAEVLAEIKPGNDASIRVFERAGFRHAGRGQVKGQEALRMILRRQVTAES